MDVRMRRARRTDDDVMGRATLFFVQAEDGIRDDLVTEVQTCALPISAVKYATQAVYIDPYDVTAHELLAELYEKAGNETGLSKERRVISILMEWKQMREQEPKVRSEERRVGEEGEAGWGAEQGSKIRT